SSNVVVVVVVFFKGSLLTYGQVLENSTSLTTMFVAAAVHSHFADCPESHSHFCFHGTCRFLIVEETPACVCQPGFIGMRCEHADLLAVVATNHTQHTVATMLVLCVVASVLLILLCTLLNCCWRRGACRQRHNLSHFSEKPNRIIKGGTSFCHPETGNSDQFISFLMTTCLN
uniref:EGF-like domain-containing protein n=1 Tax=Electrophorus electricus TaxID=8005 RepID=A0A4W4F1L3_ELEEL